MLDEILKGSLICVCLVFMWFLIKLVVISNKLVHRLKFNASTTIKPAITASQGAASNVKRYDAEPLPPEAIAPQLKRPPRMLRDQPHKD